MMRALCHYPHRRPAFGPSCTEFVYPACWHIEIGATSKIDDVLIEHGVLTRVLPLTVPTDFFGGQLEGTILRHSDSLSFVVGPLLHS